MPRRPKLVAKTRLENGVRINNATGQPDFQNTGSQRNALAQRRAAGAYFSDSGGISSSAGPILDQRNNQAMGGATTALNNNSGGNEEDDWTKRFFDRIDAREEDVASNLSEALKEADAKYKSGIARLNQNDSNLSREIEDRYNKTREIAATNAAALNPYNASRGAQTSANFQSKITENFNDAIARLHQNTEMEKGALEANNMSAVNAIRQDSRKALADLDDQIFNYGLKMKEEAESARRFEIGQENQEKTYALSKQGRAQDDFQTYINTMSGSPELQGDIDDYFSTGKIAAGLAPFIERGRTAGMATNEALSVLQYQTDKLRAQQEDDRRLANAQLNSADRQTKAMNFAAGMTAIQMKSQEMIAKGIKPGTMEYAKGISDATAGSQTGMNASEVTGYSTIANIGGQLVDLKSSLDATAKDNNWDDVWTMVVNKTGASASSLAEPNLALLTARINALAAPVARVMFGERGVLTEPDIKRVMSTLPTGASATQVRSALYKQILINARTGAINKLAIDASTYRNTTGVAPYIEQFVSEIDATLNSLGGGNSSSNSYKDPSTGRTYTW